MIQPFSTIASARQLLWEFCYERIAQQIIYNPYWRLPERPGIILNSNKIAEEVFVALGVCGNYQVEAHRSPSIWDDAEKILGEPAWFKPTRNQAGNGIFRNRFFNAGVPTWILNQTLILLSACAVIEYKDKNGEDQYIDVSANFKYKV